MQRVIIVEPDGATRDWCRLHLESQKLAVLAFGEVRPALQALRLDPPDLVIVATDLPAGGAFALVAAMRSGLRTALVPVLFLVPSQDAQAHAFALSIEPDWIVTKPLTREMLLRAVDARLRSANQIAAGRERAFPAEGAGEVSAGQSGLVLDTRQATVLVVVLRNFVSLARAMSAKPLDTVLRRFTAAASDIVAEHQGWIARGDAARLMALFEDGPKADRPHATRAIEAALRTVLAARQVKKADGLGAHGPAFPDLSVGCGVHTGEVLIARFPGAGHLSLTLAGPTVDLAQRLDGRAKGLGWSIAVSETAAAGAGGRFQLGRSASLTDADHDVSLAISEVVGFNAGFARPGELTRMAEVREAVLANSMLARLAGDIDQYSADKTIMVRADRKSRPAERLPDLPDRRVTRRIGGGRYVETYLAVHLPTGRDEVIKLVRSSGATTPFVTGYLREYRRIASLQQRNIVGVYEAGELAGDGFVALEFLPGGHLLDAIRGTLSVGQSLKCLAEMCFALDAIHAIGMAHGALRSEHLMFRAGGVLVLADFNLSERVAESVGLDRARPAGVDAAQYGDLATAMHADFRAAGRMLHAMLTGDLDLLQPEPEALSGERLRQATRLPLPLLQLQPCLDGLLGVGGVEPWRRAEDVLVELLALKEVFPFDIRESLPARQGPPNPLKALSGR